MTHFRIDPPGLISGLQSRSSSVKTSLVGKNRGEVSHADSLAPEDENKTVSESAGKDATLMKPKRMQFRVKS